MAVKKKKIISGLFLFVSLMIFLLLYLPISQAFQKNIFISFQFIFIGLIAAAGMIISTKNKSYSLEMIFWFFIFTFLFCGGITQFATDSFKWGLIATNSDIICANYMILIFMIFFMIGKRNKVKIKIRKKENFWGTERQISNRFLIPILVLLLIIGLYTIATSGLKVLFIRENFGVSGIASKLGSSSIRSLVITLIRGLATWSMMIAVNNFKQSKSINNFIFFTIALFIGIINIPPMGVARYVLAAVYGGIFVYSFDFLKKGRTLFYILSFGLLVIFPLMNAFRGHYTDTITLDFIQQSLGDISSNFTKADYDSYSMIVFAIQYVKKKGISKGFQLLGTFFFYIPSNLWRNKPSGSGATIIQFMNTGYDTNVSCPIIAEGYINFGIIGVMLFAFIIGCLVKKLDSKYWNDWNTKQCAGKMFYSFFLLFFIFLCRGDLLSTFSYLIGYIVSLVVVIKYYELFYKKRSIN